MRLPLMLAVAILVSGCATNGMNSVIGNRDCTTKINGEVAFGSITPTGKVKFSAACRPAAPGQPPNPPSPSEVPAAPAL